MGDIWQLKAKDTTIPFFMERIFNVGNGVLSTQYAIPLQHSVTPYDGVSHGKHFIVPSRTGTNIAYGDFNVPFYKPTYKPNIENKEKVLSFGVTMWSLLTPVLPNNMKFAVISNQTGQVLYHSNEAKSLLENFFQETENNAYLSAFIRLSASSLGVVELGSGTSVRFEGVYRGQNTDFFVARLHADIPWSLIVFKNKEEAQSLAATYFSTVVLISLAVGLCVISMSSLLRLWAPDMFRWVWPKTRRTGHYTFGVLVLANVSYYIYAILSMTASLEMFVAVASVLIVISLFVMGRIFEKAGACVYDGIQTLGEFKICYMIFLLSVVFTFVVVPVSLVAKKVGDDTLTRSAVYQRVQYAESLVDARAGREQYIRRLCGDPKTSVTNGSNVYPECLASLPLAKLDRLRSLFHTVKVKECNFSGLRVNANNPSIFCSNEGHDLSSYTTEFTDQVIKFLGQASEYPAAMDVLSSFGEDGYRTKFEPFSKFHLVRRSSWFGSLIFQNAIFVLILALFLLGLTIGAIYFLADRLLGIKVPKSFRLASCEISHRNWDEFVKGAPEGCSSGYSSMCCAMDGQITNGPFYGLLIRPTEKSIQDLRGNARKCNGLGGSFNPIIDVHEIMKSEEDLARVKQYLRSTKGAKKVLILSNIESIAFERASRLSLLSFLELCIAEGSPTSLIITCDVAPLYMLTHQSKYLGDVPESEYANTQEIIRWTRVMSVFGKYYDWCPLEYEFTDKNDWNNRLLREVSVWPEMYGLKELAEQERLNGRNGMNSAQLTEFISAHAGPLYNRRWNLCTVKEKLLLFQLARGMMINPMNVEPLEHLMRRGFIKRDPMWKISNRSFARFVLTAEKEEVYGAWMSRSERSFWKVLRVPLFATSFVVLGIIMYSAQETSESMLALITSLLALLPLLLRNLSMVRGIPNTSVDN